MAKETLQNKPENPLGPLCIKLTLMALESRLRRKSKPKLDEIHFVLTDVYPFPLRKSFKLIITH